MAHWAWIASDSHISWSYEQADIPIEDRVPGVLGGDRHPQDSTPNLEGYDHIDRIIDRVEEIAETQPQREHARWPVIYEMSKVMIGHERLGNFQKLAEEGVLSAESVAELTPQDLQP